MPDWVISDTHWNHTNINHFVQRLTPAFPRPEDVDDLMRRNWHGLVRHDQTIWHLGDVGYFDDYDGYYDWFADLPGNKKLIRGNHDGKLSQDFLERHGWEEIDPPVVSFAGARVLFTHYPQASLDPNEVNVHGHVHNNPSHGLTRSHLNVSVELYHYAPVHGRWVIEKAIHQTKLGAALPNDFGPRRVVRGQQRRKRKP